MPIKLCFHKLAFTAVKQQRDKMSLGGIEKKEKDSRLIPVYLVMLAWLLFFFPSVMHSLVTGPIAPGRGVVESGPRKLSPVPPPPARRDRKG